MFRLDKFMATKKIKHMADNHSTEFSAIIPQGMKIIGDVELNETSLIVEGSIEGSIKQFGSSSVTLQKEASVTGSIYADVVTINGARIISTINAKRVTLAKNAHVDGDITYDELSIELGSVMNGKLLLLNKSVPFIPLTNKIFDDNIDSLAN